MSSQRGYWDLGGKSVKGLELKNGAQKFVLEFASQLDLTNKLPLYMLLCQTTIFFCYKSPWFYSGRDGLYDTYVIDAAENMNRNSEDYDTLLN